MTIDWSRRGPAAEKTIAILKKRVRSLYNDGAQTAIHRQLERAREREEKQRQKRAVFMAKTAELERYSQELEVTVAERTADLRAILDNVTFGFVIVDRETRVLPGFTESCHGLLGTTVEDGAELCKLLRVAGSGVEAMIRMGIEQVFDDFMPEDVTVEQIPSQFALDGRRIQTEYRVIRGEGGDPEKVLVTISDVTALWEAERRAHDNAALVGILRQKSAFAAFVGDARSRLAASREAIDDGAFVRRAIHTVKGNAASYGLLDLAAEAHRIEGGSAIGRSDLDSLEESLQSFLEQHRDVLGSDLVAGGSSVEVDSEDVRELRRLLHPVDVESLEAWGRRILKRPINELVGPLEVFVDRIAERLERPVSFEVEGADLTVDPEIMQPIVGTLTHLLRNALDHGLEPESERGQKDPVGKLMASFREENGQCVVEIQDDGRGIDIEGLAAKAVASGHCTEAEAEAMGDAEKARLIFLDGLSSREEASELSGRGVGMPAVLEVVRAQGGQVLVSTKAGEGTSIRLEVPVA